MISRQGEEDTQGEYNLLTNNEKEDEIGIHIDIRAIKLANPLPKKT